MVGRKTMWVAAVVLGLTLTVPVRQTQAFTLDNVEMGYSGHREAGMLENYEFYVDVHGTGITSVRVVDQNAATYDLVYEVEPDWSGWTWYTHYGSLADVLTAHPNNQTYDFYFNEGQPDYDHDVLSYNVTGPSGFPDILYPFNGSTGVPTNTAYVWTSVAGVSNAVGIYTEVETANDGDETVYQEYRSGLTATSWQPGLLDPLTDYCFQVEAVNLHGGAPQAATTDDGLGYTYYGVFGEGNSVDFTTGTGTVPALWLTIQATAQEMYKDPPDLPDYDRFTLTFNCDNDIRLTHIAYNLGTSVGNLLFDTTYVSPTTGPGFPFTVLGDSSAVGVIGLSSLDNSPLLGIECNDFQPGETLVFGIDVDGPDNTMFSAATFHNTWLGLIFDPSPSFPGADPFLVELYFDGALAQTTVPEPGTVVFFSSGALAVVMFLRKRRLARRRVQ